MKISEIVALLVTYLTSEDGQRARKRLANKPVTREFEGKDGINRAVTSAPIGAFWEIPESLAETIKAGVAAFAGLKANKYLSFPYAGKEYEIGAVAFNNLTTASEIWFCKKGLLGQSTQISTADMFDKLDKQEVSRMVVEVDSTKLHSALNKATETLLSPAIAKVDIDLPY